MLDTTSKLALDAMFPSVASTVDFKSEHIPILNMSFDVLTLSARAYHCLEEMQKERGSALCIAHIAAMTDEDLLRRKNLGRITLKDIRGSIIDVLIYGPQRP